METRTKRMRKIKAATKRRVNRNRIWYTNTPLTKELILERKELVEDQERYVIG